MKVHVNGYRFLNTDTHYMKMHCWQSLLAKYHTMISDLGYIDSIHDIFHSLNTGERIHPNENVLSPQYGEIELTNVSIRVMETKDIFNPILQIIGSWEIRKDSASIDLPITGLGFISFFTKGLSILSKDKSEEKRGLSDAIVELYSNTEYVISGYNSHTLSEIKTITNIKSKLTGSLMQSRDYNSQLSEYAMVSAIKISRMLDAVAMLLDSTHSSKVLSDLEEETVRKHSDITDEVDGLNETVYNMIKEKILDMRLEEENQ